MTDESERSIRAAIDGEMLLLDPEVRASPARVLELLDTDFTEIGDSGQRKIQVGGEGPRVFRTGF
uniref:Nuclear transport factor 2 family protein n=1 Tax=Streptomyces sp. NBC_00119 TaxID=2975659 RepID=A0AAU1U192_9ACTN